MHGLVGLEIAGYADPADALGRYRKAVHFICRHCGAHAADVEAELAAPD
jgi:ribosomal protein L37E